MRAGGPGKAMETLRRVAGPALADRPAAPFTGDHRLTSIGWQPDRATSPWRIVEDRPLPFTLLSVTHELKVND